MQFSLQFTASLPVPLSCSQLKSTATRVNLVLEPSKSSPSIAGSIASRLARTIIQRFFSEDSLLGNAPTNLISIEGKTSTFEESLRIELSVTYLLQKEPHFVKSYEMIKKLPNLVSISAEQVPLTNEIIGSMLETYLLQYLSQKVKMTIIGNMLYDSFIESLSADTNCLELSLDTFISSTEPITDQKIIKEYRIAGTLTLYIKVKKYLIMNYKGEELESKYFFGLPDFNRYLAQTSVFAKDNTIACFNYDYGIPEKKNRKELLRSIPFEIPYKGRVYGLLGFPGIYSALKSCKAFLEVEFAAANLDELPVKRKKIEEVKESGVSFVNASEFACVGGSKSESKGKAKAGAKASKLWKDLKMDEIKAATEKLQKKFGSYRYLYEQYEREGSQDALKLYMIVADSIKKLSKMH